MTSPAREQRVASVLRSKTNLPLESAGGRNDTRKNHLAAGKSSGNMLSPKLRSTTTRTTTNTTTPASNRQYKKSPRLVVDTAADIDKSAEMLPKACAPRSSCCHASPPGLEEGWIPAQIRNIGPGRVALSQPSAAVGLAHGFGSDSRGQMMTSKRSSKSHPNDSPGKLVVMYKKAPSSPDVSALTGDGELNTCSSNNNKRRWRIPTIFRRHPEN